MEDKVWTKKIVHIIQEKPSDPIVRDSSGEMARIWDLVPHDWLVNKTYTETKKPSVVSEKYATAPPSSIGIH